jgi:hypothetical protein
MNEQRTSKEVLESPEGIWAAIEAELSNSLRNPLS